MAETMVLAIYATAPSKVTLSGDPTHQTVSAKIASQSPTDNGFDNQSSIPLSLFPTDPNIRLSKAINILLLK